MAGPEGCAQVKSREASWFATTSKPEAFANWNALQPTMVEPPHVMGALPVGFGFSDGHGRPSWSFRTSQMPLSQLREGSPQLARSSSCPVCWMPIPCTTGTHIRPDCCAVCPRRWRTQAPYRRLEECDGFANFDDRACEIDPKYCRVSRDP